MAQLLPHLALKTNKDPTTHSTGVVSTYDLALDSPRNYQEGSKLVSLQVLDSPVGLFNVMPAVRNDSPDGLLSKGKGQAMQWDIEVKCITGNAPGLGQTAENELSFVEADMLNLQGELSIGMATTNDGVSTYLWLSPNYQWNHPSAPEQWIRVVPLGPLKLAYDTAFGVSIRKMTLAVRTAKSYKSITQVNMRRGAAVYAGAGTLTSTLGSPAVVGVGTAFRTDFMYDDYLLDNSGALIGRVSAVTDDTHLTLRANGLVAVTGGAYRVQQRSDSMLSVPYYTLTGF